MKQRLGRGKRVRLRGGSVFTKYTCPLPNQLGICAILEVMPKPIYISDVNGRMTFYNKAAAALWGGEDGAAGYNCNWTLHSHDGTPLRISDSSISKNLKEKCPVGRLDAFAVRPDGSRVDFITCPTPIYDSAKNFVGVVNMLTDKAGLAIVDDSALEYQAIFRSSDDAIIVSDLLGIITSWNLAAQLLFGYTAEEAMGQSVTMLHPLGLPDQNSSVLNRASGRERVKHFESIRRRKDGSLVEVSLSVSPIENQQGCISGITNIARDITGRRRLEEQKNLLIQEMGHRVKNLFELASSVILLSARSARTVNELASSATTRLHALAKAHALTMLCSSKQDQQTTLHRIIETTFEPYADGVGGRESRAFVSGPDLLVNGTTVTSIALLLHEFVTNAAKYGSLSIAGGFVEICCSRDENLFILEWNEKNGPLVEGEPVNTGFGTRLAKALMSAHLEGDIVRIWKREGLVMKLRFRSNNTRDQHAP